MKSCFSMENEFMKNMSTVLHCITRQKNTWEVGKIWLKSIKFSERTLFCTAVPSNSCTYHNYVKNSLSNDIKCRISEIHSKFTVDKSFMQNQRQMAGQSAFSTDCRISDSFFWIKDLQWRIISLQINNLILKRNT